MLLLLQAVQNCIKAQYSRRCFHCHSCGLWLQRLFSPLDSTSLSISADPIMQLKAHKCPGNDGALQPVWPHQLISIHILSCSFAASPYSNLHTIYLCSSLWSGLFLDTMCPIFTCHLVLWPPICPSFSYTLIAFLICCVCLSQVSLAIFYIFLSGIAKGTINQTKLTSFQLSLPSLKSVHLRVKKKLESNDTHARTQTQLCFHQFIPSTFIFRRPPPTLKWSFSLNIFIYIMKTFFFFYIKGEASFNAATVQTVTHTHTLVHTLDALFF